MVIHKIEVIHKIIDKIIHKIIEVIHKIHKIEVIHNYVNSVRRKGVLFSVLYIMQFVTHAI